MLVNRCLQFFEIRNIYLIGFVFALLQDYYYYYSYYYFRSPGIPYQQSAVGQRQLNRECCWLEWLENKLSLVCLFI